MTYDTERFFKKMKKDVDFPGDCDILIPVMRNTFDDLSCEEVFELNAVCEDWQNEAIEAQDADADWIRANTKLVKVSEK